MPDNLNWDDPQIGGDESFTEDDMKDAESMGKVPVGKYLCVCVESVPREINFRQYATIAAGLKWQIERVIELDNEPVKGDAGDVYIGRFLYDDVAFYHPQEKDGFRKRRLLIARRVGLVKEGETEITKQMWAHDIVGKRAVLSQVTNTYKGEKRLQIGFSGYESPESVETVTDDEFSDI